MKMTTPEEAKKILSDVKPEFRFYTLDGKALKNIQELFQELIVMSNEVFNHHVLEKNNDFSNWVREIVMDEEIVDEMLKSKDKAQMIKVIKKRIDELQNCIKNYVQSNIQKVQQSKILNEVLSDKKLKDELMNYIIQNI